MSAIPSDRQVPARPKRAAAADCHGDARDDEARAEDDRAGQAEREQQRHHGDDDERQRRPDGCLLPEYAQRAR